VILLPRKTKVSLLSCPNPSLITRTTRKFSSRREQSRPYHQPRRRVNKSLTGAAVRTTRTNQKTPYACQINLTPVLRSARVPPPTEVRVSSSRVVPLRRGMSSQGTATARAIVRTHLQLTVTLERAILMFSKTTSTKVLENPGWATGRSSNSGATTTGSTTGLS